MKFRKLTPYEKFLTEELILRDLLAADRTKLANERTFLAFIRTALTLSVVGLSLMKFFNSLVSGLLSYTFIIAGVCIFIIGLYRYYEWSGMINKIRGKRKQKKILITKLSSDSYPINKIAIAPNRL